MMRKISVLVLALLLSIGATACSSSEETKNESKKAESSLPSIGKEIVVSKKDKGEDWIIRDGSVSEEWEVPQFNVDVQKAEEFNSDIKEKVQSAESEKCLRISYTAGVKDALASVVLLIEYSDSKIDYSVYNLSLSDGTVPSNESVMSYFGLEAYQFRELCREALKTEYVSAFYSFSDSSPDIYSESLNKTMSVENLSECIPYVSASEELCFVGKMYVMGGGERMLALSTAQRGLN